MKKILMLIVLIGSASQILAGHGSVCCPHSGSEIPPYLPCEPGLYCRPNCNESLYCGNDASWHCAYHSDVCWYPAKYN